MNRRRLLVAAALIVVAALVSGCALIGDAAADPGSGGPAIGAPTDDSPGGDTPKVQNDPSGAPPADDQEAGPPDGNRSRSFGSGTESGAESDVAEGTAEIGIDGDGDGVSEAAEPEPPSTIVKLTISAAGDVTLGGDPRYSNSFIREFDKHGQDHSVFLRNVRHIFEEDDLTIVNLEGPLTEATAHLDKGYVFRGPPHFAKILSSSGVDAVTLANNHIKDFLARGYEDTVEALEAEGVLYFGNEFNTITEINGIKVGMFGFLVWYDGKDNRNRITAAIKDLRDNGAQLVIAYYHWGDELAKAPGAYQKTMGRFTIDSGADLVLGAHAHVIQGIEEYKGKNIVYSLANFCFGGNNNPRDKDTFIFQQTFTFDEGVLLDTNDTNIIPVRSSSTSGWNDFMPKVAEGDEAERILQRIREHSDALNRSG